MTFSCESKLTKSFFLRIFVSLFLIISSQAPIVQNAYAESSGCLVGSSSTCPGDSAWHIKQATGTNTNGVYWVLFNGSATKVYAIMDSTMGGGGWMLAMKGSNTGTSFPYSSNYWTTNNTLTPSGEANPTNIAGNNSDAKYDVYNQAIGNQILGIFPGYVSTGNGGAYPGNPYGFSWAETTTATVPFGGSNASTSYYSPYLNPSAATINLRSYGAGTGANCPSTPGTLLSLLGGTPVRCLIKQPKVSYDANEAPYSVIGNGIFTSQRYIQFFGFNYTNSQRAGYNVRWGLGWNENSTFDEGSTDASGGIGGSWGKQAGDFNGCCTIASGKNTQMAFEMYVRNTSTSLTPVTASLSAGTPSPNGGTVNLNTANTTWTATAVNNSNGGSSLTVTGTGPLTISGANPNDSITVTLTYTADPGYSGYGTLTYSFFASNGTATLDLGLLSGLLETNYRTLSPITSVITGTPGKVSYYIKPVVGPRKIIAKCKRLATTVNVPYSSTCAWKPSIRGSVTIMAEFTPTNNSYLSATKSFVVYVARRIGNR